ncbi:hypothetical protein K2173_001635 [Erythroxylum novogranatense]|uniref:F-box domain-containing protein n=1 Tax=Erythroxylum novogranatense TaxID=1862640 RepID=A0AAV8T417_9ROSI|nr:hypothetical protein K2173_001635 [Erythroxylum novogranatense]
MALGKRSNSERCRVLSYTQSVGSKRVLIPMGDWEMGTADSSPRAPLKKNCCWENQIRKSHLENLPQDVLIRIICGVNHHDLRQLIHVSRTIREATLIARKTHFAYLTPRKVPAFGNWVDREAPNAPKGSRAYGSRLKWRDLLTFPPMESFS